MSFLNPILLFGLGAVAVPVVIHLLNRRKFRRVAWAAMRFLQTSVERSRRKMRVEDLLLLALRCLILILLALALSRPAARSPLPGLSARARATAVIILDNSRSMGMSDGSRSRFDKARQAAGQILDALPAGSSAALLLVSGTAGSPIPEPTRDLNLARKSVREAQLSDLPPALPAAIGRALDLLARRSPERPEVYLLTDGQLAGWENLEETARLIERQRPLVRPHVILVNEQEERNAGISSFRLASGLAPVNQPLRFEVQVENFGRQEIRNLPVQLAIGNDPPADEFIIDQLQPASSKTISLFARFKEPTDYWVTARLPPDRLAADDSRTIAIHTVKELRVLVVEGPRDSGSGSSFFLQHALQPVPEEERGRFFLRMTVRPRSDLASLRLDDYAAVILSDLPDFPTGSAAAFEQYLRRGGGVVIFPGEKTKAASYQEVFGPRHLLPSALGAATGDPRDDTRHWALQASDYQHPTVSIWNDPASGTLASARFFRRFSLAEPVPRAAGASNAVVEAAEPQVIVRYDDGAPAVMERNWAAGKVILFSSSPDTSWNDLPIRPAFVPLLHRVIGSIVQRQEEGMNLSAGEKFSRSLPPDLLGKEAVITVPAGGPAEHLSRRVEVVEGEPRLEFEGTGRAGGYAIDLHDPSGVMKFAVQAGRAESTLQVLSAGQLERLGQACDVIPWRAGMALKQTLTAGRTGAEFWFPLAVATLLAAVAETFLARWFSRSK